MLDVRSRMLDFRSPLYYLNLLMTRKELQARTKKFHVDVIKLCEGIPKNAAGFETAKQLIKAAGSVGANYRASVRAKSSDDSIK